MKDKTDGHTHRDRDKDREREKGERERERRKKRDSSGQQERGGSALCAVQDFHCWLKNWGTRDLDTGTGMADGDDKLTDRLKDKQKDSQTERLKDKQTYTLKDITDRQKDR